MAVACLLVPRFALACELAERPELARQASALAVVDGRRVLEACPAAERYGVRASQRLPQAFACYPHLLTVEARPALYQQQFAAMLDALARISPAVEPGPPGVAYVDLGTQGHEDAATQGRSDAGTQGLGIGDRGVSMLSCLSPLASCLLACAPAALQPRLGIGQSKFPALIAAHRTQPGQVCVLPEDAATTLAPVAVEYLPVPDEIQRRLRLLGLETLGKLAALPKAAVAAQFGPVGAHAWELARGRDPDPVRPRRQLETIAAQLSFEAPVVSREAILAAAEQLLSQGVHALACRHQAARRAILRAVTERGQSWERVVTFKEALPSSERARLWTALKPVLEVAKLPGPVTSLALELAELAPAVGRQEALWAGEVRRREHLLETLRQLKTRYGHCPVSRVVEVEPWSRIPERRAALIAFDP